MSVPGYLINAVLRTVLPEAVAPDQPNQRQPNRARPCVRASQRCYRRTELKAERTGVECIIRRPRPFQESGQRTASVTSGETPQLVAVAAGSAIELSVCLILQRRQRELLSTRLETLTDELV